MYAFTLWQPWASLVIAGLKPFEFRRHAAPKFVVGQRVVIHAGSRPVRVREVLELRDRLQAGDDCGGMDRAAILLLTQLATDASRMPLAAGLGTAILGTPRLASDIWPEDFQEYNDSDRVEHSNWAWPLASIEAFKPIVPTPGRQGFWRWPWAGAPQ